MRGVILRNWMTVQLFLGSSLSSVPVKKQKHLQLIAFPLFFPLVPVIFHSLFPDFFFFIRRDIPCRTSPTSLRHEIYQKHFCYNVYNNRNHVHSPHIYSHFQRASPQGLAKKSEWTMMTKGNLFMSLKGYFRCQFGYSLHGVLAKIILRSCVTRDGAICIKNVRFQYFDGTNPITGKGVSYSILQRFWVMLVS